jgi:hypothetical protein
MPVIGVGEWPARDGRPTGPIGHSAGRRVGQPATIRTYGFCAAALQSIGALSAAAAVLGVLCLFAAVILQLVVGPGVTVGGTVFRLADGPIVVLTRVHPSFVEAVRRRQSGE